MAVTNSKRALVIAAAVVATLASAQDAIAGWSQTAGGTYLYTDSANWTGGVVDGIWPSTLALAGAQTVTFNSDLTLTPMLFNYTGAQNVTLQSDSTTARTLTLSGDIVASHPIDRTVQFGGSNPLNIDLGGVTRTFEVVSGGGNKYLTIKNAISNGGLTKLGGGTLTLEGVNTYTGNTNVNGGYLVFMSASRATSSAITASNGGILRFNNAGTGLSSVTRGSSLALRGGAVEITANNNTSTNTNDVIAGGLTLGAGQSTVTMSPVSNRHMRMTADIFTREAGGAVLFRGTSFGINTLASNTVNATNLVFTNAPALTGGTGQAGETNIPIIKGAYGGSASNNSGDALVTYDATYGVRPLSAATEYKTAITSGQTALDNVRYARTSGGASQDINLSAETTTVNALVFDISGAGTNSGVTISGDADTALKLNTGMILARQTVTTAAATDAMTLSVPKLDLNGQEGVFIAITAGVSNGNTPAPLQINSSIGNDGGNGVTIGGTGQTIFGGAAAHTYTGVTTLNSGILRLAKTTTNIGIPGDLVMNGGTLLKNSNAIPDSASLTINGGTFWMDSTTSSGNNNHAETLHNFTINGGSFGNHGSNAVLNINGDAAINGSQLGMNQGGDITVLGTTTLNGGLLLAREASSTSTYNGLTALKDVVINNKASGAYTAITLNSHASNLGAKLTLSGDLTFAGNESNSNTVRIASSDTALANQGIIALAGERIFTIGNGAAADDLTIVPALVNGTVAGGLVKAGAGTLKLDGASTYTGDTRIDAGVLALGATGSLASSKIEITAGATFDTSLQSLAMSGAQTIVFGIDGAGVGSAGLLNAGELNISAGTIEFVTVGTLDDDAYLLASYTSLVGTSFANFPTVAGYEIDYSYEGNNIALVAAVPEPGTIALASTVAGIALSMRRRRSV